MTLVSLAIVLIFLLWLSGFFSGSEIGVLSCSRIKVQNLAAKGDPKIKRLQTLLGDRKRVVILILIFTNITNTTYTLVGEALLHKAAHLIYPGRESAPIGVLLSTLCLTPPLVIFGEIFPKSLFRHYSFTLTKKVAPVLFLLQKIYVPFLLVFSMGRGTRKKRRLERLNFSKDYLHLLLESSTETGKLMDLQENIIKHILSLEGAPLADFTTLLPEGPALASNMKGRQALQFIRNTQIPAPYFIQRKGKILGHITLKDLWSMNDNTKLEIECQALPKISGQEPALAGLTHLLMTNHRYALVTEGKRITGFVSIKDLLTPGF